MAAIDVGALLTPALDIMLKSLLVTAAVLLATWFMRRSSASQRHLYLSAAVLLLLLMPPASALLPSWDVGTLPDPFAPAVVEPGAGDAAVTGTRQADGESQAPAAVSADGPGGRTAADGAAAGGKSAAAWIFYAWAAGAAILLLRLVGGKLYGNWIAARAPAIDDDRILAAVGRVSRLFRIARPLPVVESDHLRVPFVSGLLRHRLVMPSQARTWPLERIEAILHHEFAHIRRKDTLTQFLAQAACCIYWINPLAWIMERRLFIERERACDDSAISLEIKASDYAGYLMEVMEEMGEARSHGWVMSAMAEGTDFKDRIISVLDPLAARTAPRPVHSIAVAVLFAILLLPLSALDPWTGRGAVAGDATERTAAVETESGRAPGGERGTGAGGLESTGESRIDALIALLESPVANEREHAATALGRSGSGAAVDPLIRALRDRDASVREHVATALGELGSGAAVMPLAEALGDRDASVREHVATALGQLRDERALAPMIDILRSDRIERVREHAASAVGMIGGDRAYDALVEAYHNDGDIRIRAHAAYGLGLVGDDRALDLLIDGLNSEHAVMRAHCVDALALMGGSRAMSYVRRALDDPSSEVRSRAREALDRRRR